MYIPKNHLDSATCAFPTLRSSPNRRKCSIEGIFFEGLKSVPRVPFSQPVGRGMGAWRPESGAFVIVFKSYHMFGHISSSLLDFTSHSRLRELCIP